MEITREEEKPLPSRQFKTLGGRKGWGRWRRLGFGEESRGRKRGECFYMRSLGTKGGMITIKANIKGVHRN